MSKIKVFRPDDEYIDERGVQSWSIWEKVISDFPWSYDETEECFILGGEAEIVTEEGRFQIKTGDFVTFERGLSCRWLIKNPIRKHYNFL